ncbi:protein crumbs isoform X2 [Bemisia tabaci]|uniref:protein crumbs isoform X2 n=1 Tax=Bemisia tabaci TaxID=7038 RepID=UPI003B28996B
MTPGGYSYHSGWSLLPLGVLFLTSCAPTFSIQLPGSSLDSTPGPPSLTSSAPSLSLPHREGFFNVTSYARLTPIALNQHIALSFKSCVGGQLFTQRSALNNQQIILEVHREGVVFIAIVASKRFETRLNVNLLDNTWHTVTLLYRSGNLSISVSGHSQLIANATFNPEILKIAFNANDNPEFLVGKGFVGCIQEGPSIVLNSTSVQSFNVIWGPCIMDDEPCNIADLCALDPCLTHGVCFQRGDRYLCQCSARYSGNNCEIDNGSPCAPNVNPCENNGVCQETPRGDYICHCPPGFTGQNCEDELLMTTCDDKTCGNNGSCRLVPGKKNSYECACPPGALCELNVDECSSKPCMNGGICLDGINGYRCNCSEDFMGANCELDYNVCAFNPCENNGTCINKTSRDYVCECKSGFEGQNCEKNINDCLHVECPDKRVCVDLVNSYECRCPEGFIGENCSENISHCSNSPCKHNATCEDTPHNYTCHCPPGFEGRHCEADINECEKTKDICNYGICVNNAGSYQCFCRPGFSGDHCDVDFDECLSKPCFNGATCQNKINGFSCICTPGYTGKECNININECQSNPCLHGATCIDGIAAFTCACPVGLTGIVCETNIDDCQSSPCLHNGACIDGINSYTCNCSDTGYEGAHCEVNINDCISNPCVNGAKCVDGVKDYDCICFNGFTGKNCEIDINECESNPCQFNGTCLEHSDIDLFVGRHPTTPPPMMGTLPLPKFFHQDFNYSIASGYECVCVPGVMGTNCEINIQECDSNPCLHGVCQDQIGGYICECEDGFEGLHCETDINECEKYKPCVHGVCIDKRANYFCECPPQYGGKNCSVELVGCNEPNACLNNGTCKPYLDNETEHKFNCTCPYGFHGQICEKVTTMSLSGNSYIMVNTSRDEGYDISFRFKTTLPSGLLALGSGPTYYILKLAQGRLNLHSSLLNKWEGVFIGSQLNDSNWHKVFVAINASHLVLSANEEQTIYPINLNEGATAAHTSFPTTYVGGTTSNLRIFTHGPTSFIGCTQNIIINGQWVVPGDKTNTAAQFFDIEVGCPRRDQCNPNPCQNSGHCIDAWSRFNCTCERPFLGNTCQYNYTAATFGHENSTGSIVSVAVASTARRAIRTIVDISMFIRTRQAKGAIFYLGSSPGTVSFSDETHIAAELEGGELLVRIQLSGSQESYTVGGVKLDDGHNHLIQVVRNVTLVQVKINGTEYFRKTISATGQLDAQVLLLGGMPHLRSSPTPVRQTRNVDRSVRQASDTVSPFKGIIQDVQINNGITTMVVEFFPLRVSDVKIPASFGNVTFDSMAVLQGVISDDSCASNPCANEGECTVTWNDFSCSCPVGYKGKTCQEMEFCQLQDCPLDSECHNLHHGFECVANLTLDGSGNTSLQYTLSRGEQSVPLNSIEFSYRSRYGGMILHISNSLNVYNSDRIYFSIYVFKDQISVAWKLDPNSSREVRKFGKEKADGGWTSVILKIGNNSIQGGFIESSDEPGLSFPPTNFSSSQWENLLINGFVMVGGGETGVSDRNSYITEDGDSTNHVDFSFPEMAMSSVEKYHYKMSSGYYKGCIGEIRIGGLLLPYFTPKQLNSSYFNLRDYFSLTTYDDSEPDVELGCYLCSPSECLNGGKCTNIVESYNCDCPPGYEGDDCSVNIDECANSGCKNSATCVDGIANYTCICPPGWEGWLCDSEINECESNPCLNGGTCLDFVGYFDCSCTPKFVGKICDQLKQVTCSNAPCRNGSTCIDVKNPETSDNFTCSCAEGYVGTYCDIPYCMQEPCKNGGACFTNRPVPFCECAPGFRGELCDENIDDCENSPCKNSGHCIDGIDSFSCNCTGTGYEGATCEIDINECMLLTVKCGEKGKCVNENGGYHCECDVNDCGYNCEMANPCAEFNPCQNGGTCEPVCIDISDYKCICPPGHAGKNCTESPEYSASNFSDIAIIIGPILAILIIATAISLTVFVMMARKKRAMRGTYSPSSQEYCNPRVELDNVMKPPPEERLI